MHTPRFLVSLVLKRFWPVINKEKDKFLRRFEPGERYLQFLFFLKHTLYTFLLRLFTCPKIGIIIRLK